MAKQNNQLKVVSSSSKALEAKEALFNEDIWQLKSLGYKDNEIAQSLYRTVSFKKYRISWLADLFKETVWRKRVSVTPNTIGCYVSTGRTLDDSLSRITPRIVSPKSLRREHIESFLVDVASRSKQTQQSHISRLNEIFHCWQEWSLIGVAATELIYRGDAPRHFRKPKPRFIEPVSQEKIRDKLRPTQVALDRAVAILQETGMRGNEVLHLNRDCLTQDNQGNWYLTRHNLKINESHTVPISEDLRVIIELQVKYIKDLEAETKKKCNLDTLFVHYWRSKFRHYTLRTFIRHISELSDEAQTVGSDGEKLNITSHMFRHTVGTNLINDGVPQIFVQRFLGHKSPAMTAVYAHIHDKTLREAIQNANQKLVDINGDIYETEEVVNSISQQSIVDIDAKWLKSNISAQVLPNGICALPIKQTCPHANACLTCPSFRTDATFLPILKEQLERTKSTIFEAKKNSMTRQVELNTTVRNGLTNIIEAIEND